MHTKLAGRFVLREFKLFIMWFVFQYPEMLKPAALIACPDMTRKALLELGDPTQYFLTLIDSPELFPMPGVD